MAKPDTIAFFPSLQLAVRVRIQDQDDYDELIMQVKHLGERGTLLSSNDGFASSQRNGATNHPFKRLLESTEDVYDMASMVVSR